MNCHSFCSITLVPCSKQDGSISYAESIKDFVSKDLLKDILNSEEEHVDWLETQLNLYKALGKENYLQSQT